MAREIRPIFENVEDPQVAEALSEPFMRPNDFIIQRVREEILSEDEFIAGSVSYLDDEGKQNFGFAINTDNLKPLANAQALLEGHSNVLASHSKRRSTMLSAFGNLRLGGNLEAAKSNTREVGLRTMAAVMIFAPENSPSPNHGLVVPRCIAIDIPNKNGETFRRLSRTPEGLERIRMQQAVFEEKGDPEHVEKARKDMLEGDQEMFMKYGMFIGSLLLPEIAVVRRSVDEHPAVAGFISLPRKERRKMLKDEARLANANWN
jgi:hypothetical protein